MPEVVWVTPAQVMGAVLIQVLLILLAVAGTLWVVWPNLASRTVEVEPDGGDVDATAEIPTGVSS